MDVLKNVTQYIETTGSTWYTPANPYEYRKGVSRHVLSEKNGMFTLPKIRWLEEDTARYAVARLHYRKVVPVEEKVLNMLIGMYEASEGVKLDGLQKNAIIQAVNSQLFVLTGGPGTGKTTVLKGISFVLKAVFNTKDVLFLSPTGKAARRITESTGEMAYTAASAMGLSTEDSKPQKLSNKVVIVDESSMLDTITAHALFSSLDLDSKLILVGDVEQLPSVGYGAVLRDLIDAGVPCVKLTKTFRQASESGLFANIEQIKVGLKEGFVERPDFQVFHVSDTDEARNTMVQEYLDAVKLYGKEGVVLLTPYRKYGDICAIQFNRILQHLLNPGNGKKVSYTIAEENGYKYSVELHEGDPVMQLVNTSSAANGDTGFVKEINTSGKYVIVSFGFCTKRYNWRTLGEITLAYAMSVHKSQGSEYPCVITSAMPEDMAMLSRNTIYTAITRAKKECRVITSGDTAQKACGIEAGYERITGLCEDIRHQEGMYHLLSAAANF